MLTHEAVVTAPPAAGWRDYLELTKPRVVLLITFTAVAGMYLAEPGPVPWPVLLFATLGIAMVAAAGAAANHVLEWRLDAQMSRTESRPLPTGRLSRWQALSMSAALSGFGIGVLLAATNVLATALTFCTLVGYALIYTCLLKRRTPQNIVWGGAAGAAPPVLGWTAVTGEVHFHALLLFLIIFIWTPAHFWPLAIRRREDYARAGLPMLPVTHGVDFTTLQVVLYTLMLVAVSLFPYAVGMSGGVYVCAAGLLGAGFLYRAVVLYRNPSDYEAMRTFSFSIFYLGALFAALIIDHVIRHGSVLGAS